MKIEGVVTATISEYPFNNLSVEPNITRRKTSYTSSVVRASKNVLGYISLIIWTGNITTWLNLIDHKDWQHCIGLQLLHHKDWQHVIGLHLHPFINWTSNTHIADDLHTVHHVRREISPCIGIYWQFCFYKNSQNNCSLNWSMEGSGQIKNRLFHYCLVKWRQNWQINNRKRNLICNSHTNNV